MAPPSKLELLTPNYFALDEVPTATICSIALMGRLSRRFSLYGIVIEWCAPSRFVCPPLEIEHAPT